MQGIIVTAEGVGAGVALLGGIVAVVNWTVSKTVDARLGSLREDLQKWINGSFMRAAEVNAKLDGVTIRLEHIETNGCAKRGDHE